METCVFCKIIAKQIPASPVLETDSVIVIKDINPQAPIHYLIIPKKHIVSVAHLTESDTQIASDLLLVAQKLSEIDSRHASFQLISNNGAPAGQVVFHLHIHFLAGKR